MPTLRGFKDNPPAKQSMKWEADFVKRDIVRDVRLQYRVCFGSSYCFGCVWVKQVRLVPLVTSAQTGEWEVG